MFFRNSPRLRRVLGILLFAAGIVSGVIACGLLVMHTQTFSLKRDTAVMIGSTLPELKSSVALLDANIQAETLFSQNALASREEQASVFVLPDGPAASRAVSSLQEIALAITKDAGGAVTVSTVTFDAAPVIHGSYKTLGAHLAMKGDAMSVARFLAILGYSGDMMVRDLFTDRTAEQFLRQVEDAAPLSLKPAEDFLYLDLLQYAAAPDQAEQNMLKDMPTGAQADIRSFVLQAGLAGVRSAFDRIAQHLKDKAVWPLPLVSVDHLQRSGDVWDADLLFYRR